MAVDQRTHRENLIIEASGDTVTTVGGTENDPLTIAGDVAIPGGPGANRFGAIRDRLFHVMLVKMALSYRQHVSYTCRRFIEFFVFIMALTCLSSLIYIHVLYNRSPGTCLKEIRDVWPKKGVLRIEVIHNFEETNQAQNRLLNGNCEFDLRKVLIHGLSALPPELRQKSILKNEYMKIDWTTRTSSANSTYFINTINSEDSVAYFRIFAGDSLLFKLIKRILTMLSGFLEWSDDNDYYDGGEDATHNDAEKNYLNLDEKMYGNNTEEYLTEPRDQELFENFHSISAYIVEYSLHYGLLKLTPAMREEYGVPVMVVQLDADSNECFGDWRNRFLMRHFIGFEEVVMLSLRWLAENETDKGYLRDMVTGDHYHFVNAELTRYTYVVALFVMLVFTFAISMLLRFSHQQIFLFIVELLQMFEMNQPLVFPVAPLLTVILALIGMEAIMSEIFNDTSTAFYVILLVWIADQYDAICCQSSIGKRHWLRFFYLYHYAFYAHHYRYNGQYSCLALVTSTSFILHSMIYFFHHYEIPLIVYQQRLRQVVNDLQHNTMSDSATLNVSIELEQSQGHAETAHVSRGLSTAVTENSGDNNNRSSETNAGPNLAGGEQPTNFVTCTIQHFLRGNRRHPIIQRILLENPANTSPPNASVIGADSPSTETLMREGLLRRAGIVTADQLIRDTIDEIFTPALSTEAQEQQQQRS